MSIITDSLTEAYAEGKPLWSRALNTLFVLAGKPKVESKKAFCQVVNAATKCDSGVFKFKTSQAITAEKKNFKNSHCNAANATSQSEFVAPRLERALIYDTRAL